MPVVSRPQPGVPARLVYVRRFTDTNIWRIETSSAGAAATSPPVMAISSTRSEGVPALSPDGRRVVFTSDRSGELEMWVADAGGTNPIQLTSMGFSPGYGRWSPDGKTIAFHSNPEGHGDIFVVPADGGKPRKLTDHPATDTFPCFSRDGQWIYFSSNRTGGHVDLEATRIGRRRRSGLARPRGVGDRVTERRIPLLLRALVGPARPVAATVPEKPRGRQTPRQRPGDELRGDRRGHLLHRARCLATHGSSTFDLKTRQSTVIVAQPRQRRLAASPLLATAARSSTREWTRQ